jgi:putative aldouronate transport system permease protein
VVIRQGLGDRIFNILNVAILTAILVIMAYPLYFVLIASISNTDLVNTGKVIFLPKALTADGYKIVMKYNEVWIGYRNTLFYATAATLVHLAVTIPAAYSLSRRDFKFKAFFTVVFMIPMMFGGGLIPYYMLITQTLKINDTIWIMILPGATSFFQLTIARTFFRTTIPDELRESAEIDGASNFLVFFKIVIPLSAAIIAVLALQSAVGNWNAFFNAMMFLSDREGKNLRPLQVILRNILIMTQSQAAIAEQMADQTNAAEKLRLTEQLKYALIIVSALPVLIIYPFIQKHFVKGVMIGSIKG